MMKLFIFVMLNILTMSQSHSKLSPKANLSYLNSIDIKQFAVGEKISCIYKITSPSGKVYIGQTIDYRRRMLSYFRLKPAYLQRKLFYSLGKYGFKNHKFEIIELVENELMDEREEFWIKHYNSTGKNGLNLTHGKGALGYKCSDWAKHLISTSNSKSVYQYDLHGNYLNEYSSAALACKITGTNAMTLSACAHGKKKYKHANGFLWRFFKADKIEAVAPTKKYLYGFEKRPIKLKKEKIIKESKINLIEYKEIGKAKKKVRIIKQKKEKLKRTSIVAPKRILNKRLLGKLLRPNKIIVTDKNGNFIMKEWSMELISKKLNIQEPNLNRVLNKKRKSVNGYLAFYEELPPRNNNLFSPDCPRRIVADDDGFQGCHYSYDMTPHSELKGEGWDKLFKLRDQLKEAYKSLTGL